MFVTLDKKIAKEFYDCARTTIEYPNDYGSMRRLREDLQELCGITELEAHNVLINRNVADYIGKYNGGVAIKKLQEKEHIISESTNLSICSA